MNFLIVVAVLSCATAPSFAGNVIYRLCPGVVQQATISSIEISGCDEVKCEVHKGDEITFKNTFTPNIDVTLSIAKAYATQRGVTLPYPLESPLACNNMDCPLLAGVTAVYTTTIPVYDWVFLGPGTIKGILDFDGKPGICFETDLEVVE